MNDTLKKNLDVLKIERPRVYARIASYVEQLKDESFNPLEQEVYAKIERPNPNALPNLKFHREDPPFDGFMHAEDPISEAKEVFEKADLKHPQIVFFFGIGVGHMPQMFYQSRPDKNYAMVIVEKYPEIFLQALSAYDFTKIIEDRTVYFILQDDPRHASSLAGGIFGKHSSVSRFVKILALPKALQIDAQFYEDVARGMMKERDHSVINVGNSVEDSLIGFQNVVENIDRSFNNSGILPFFGSALGSQGTVIACGAGPSLEEHWDTLKECVGKVPIFVCDTLLRPMLEHGIEPDVVTAIERVHYVTEYFEGVKIPERTSLVGPLLLLNESFEAFEGHHIPYCPGNPYAIGLGLNYLGVFMPGASSGLMTAALAGFMGFKNVILLGHDLAFGVDTQTSHVKGTGHRHQETPLSEEELEKKSKGLKVQTADEKDIAPTTLIWTHFRNQLEHMVAVNPSMRFINTSFKGAKIQNTELMSFQDALAELNPTDFDFYSFRKKGTFEVPEEEEKRRRKIVFDQTQRKYDQCCYWLEKGKKVHKRLESWKKEIEEKEEKGKPVSLAFLDDAIDDVLRVKVKAVNEDSDFNDAVISIIGPAHTTFERVLNEMPGTYEDNYSLKRDFLLRHLQYFEIWLDWIPKICDQLESYLKRAENPQPSQKTSQA